MGAGQAVGVGMMVGAAPGYWSLIFSSQPGAAQAAMTRPLESSTGSGMNEAILEHAKTGALLSEALGLQFNAQRANGNRRPSWVPFCRPPGETNSSVAQLAGMSLIFNAHRRCPSRQKSVEFPLSPVRPLAR